MLNNVKKRNRESKQKLTRTKIVLNLLKLTFESPCPILKEEIYKYLMETYSENRNTHANILNEYKDSGFIIQHLNELGQTAFTFKRRYIHAE